MWVNRKKYEDMEDVLEIQKFDLQRLAQYDDLMLKLKKHDYFVFNSGGGIIAYNKGEAPPFGTAYIVPEKVGTIRMIRV